MLVCAEVVFGDDLAKALSSWMAAMVVLTGLSLTGGNCVDDIGADLSSTRMTMLPSLCDVLVAQAVLPVLMVLPAS